jgi:poly(A) polymerase
VDGQRDIEAGIVRAIGDPAERLAEDHLRALRAVRFAARLGFMIDPGTCRAITESARELQGVSRERIGHEIRLMLSHPNRVEAAGLLQSLRLDGPTLNEPNLLTDDDSEDKESGANVSTGSGPGQESESESESESKSPRGDRCGLQTLSRLDVRASYPSALAAWALDRARTRGSNSHRSSELPKTADLVKRWRTALLLTNVEQRVLRAVLRDHQTALADWSTLGIADQKRLAARTTFEETLHLVRAIDSDAAGAIDRRLAELSGHAGGIAPTPLVNGDDLIELGITPGPSFRRILDFVYDAQLEGRISTVEQARQMAAGMGDPGD